MPLTASLEIIHLYIGESLSLAARSHARTCTALHRNAVWPSECKIFNRACERKREKYTIHIYSMEEAVKKTRFIIIIRTRANHQAGATPRVHSFHSICWRIDRLLAVGRYCTRAGCNKSECTIPSMRKRLCVSARVHAWPSAREGASRIVINFVLVTWLCNAIAVFPVKIAHGIHYSPTNTPLCCMRTKQ